MGGKPWISEDGGRRLEAFLGARGMKTSEIATTDELIQTAAGVFEIPMETTCLKMADAVAALPKESRRKLAKKNLGPACAPRPRSPGRPVLSSLADELGVPAADLAEILHGLIDRRKAAADSQTKTLSQRAAEAASSWGNGKPRYRS